MLLIIVFLFIYLIGTTEDMVRTRGGGSSQGGHDEDRVQRRRPTASARRERVVIDDEAPVQVEAVTDMPAVASQVDPADDGHGFPGGPRDTSILISYADHVACQLWSGEVFHYYIH